MPRAARPRAESRAGACRKRPARACGRGRPTGDFFRKPGSGCCLPEGLEERGYAPKENAPAHVRGLRRDEAQKRAGAGGARPPEGGRKRQPLAAGNQPGPDGEKTGPGGLPVPGRPVPKAGPEIPAAGAGLLLQDSRGGLPAAGGGDCPGRAGRPRGAAACRPPG